MGKHGGKRDNAGRKPNSERAPPKGQQKMPGAATLPKRAPAVNVQEKRAQDEKEALRAQQREEACRRREERAQQPWEEKEAKRRRDEEAAAEALQRLVDEANNSSQLTPDVDGDEEENYDDSDDEEYCYESENEEESEGDNELDVDLCKPSRKRPKYKPPKDSLLALHLDSLKTSIFQTKKGVEDLENGRQWFPPDYDPVSKCSFKPGDWHRARVWAFAWDPRRQCKDKMGDFLKHSAKCIHCGHRASAL